MVKVTIGLSVYNGSEHIRNTIRSIIHQTFEDWECIIIDDGSTDGGIDTIRDIIDDRFTLIVDGKNMGLTQRLNQITNLSGGKYIARMDSDDIMHPQRLERQVEFLDGNREIDLVGSSAYLIDVENNIYGVRDVANDFTLARLLVGSPFVHPSIMGRREWFENNPYEPTAHRVEDYELWLRAAESSRFSNLSTPLIYYREAGLPYVEKYKLTSRGMRRVARRYVSQDATARDAYKAILMSLGKQAAFVLLHQLGKGEELMRARARKLDALEYLNASLDLSRAIRCK